MSKSVTTLETALDAVRKLPADVQEAIASDMIEAAAAYNKSHLTATDLRPKFPPLICRVLGFNLMALRGQFVH